MNYTNPDLAIALPAERTWTAWHFAALWIGMSFCIPSYMLASSLIEGGMNWWQAVLTIFLGNAVVLVPMLLSGHAGARYGIPFPVLARASFGLRGANVPALLRAIVACGWFGIQVWIGGSALSLLIGVWTPVLHDLPPLLPNWVGLATGPALCFLAFWALNIAVVYHGIEGIRRLLAFKAVILPVLGFALIAWALVAVDGLGPILARPAKFADAPAFWHFFFPALTGVVGYWATLSLNIPDFTRYARTSRAQVLGQSIALPGAMTAVAIIGVVVTSASAIIFGRVVWDPIELASHSTSPLLVTVSMLAVLVATLATNVAANIVSPANDFANLAPSFIDFKRGGLITGLIGIAMMPWRLVSDPSGYIFTWLVAYSSLLGPIGAIILVDFYLVRRGQLQAAALYQTGGIYWYKHGVNSCALLALILGVLPNLPGFLVATKFVSPALAPAWLIGLYDYAWFIRGARCW